MWRHNGWRHQNGLNAFLNFKVKFILSERAFRTGIKQRKPFLATIRKTRVMGLQRNLNALPESYFSLKNDPYVVFSQFFLQNKLIFRYNKPLVGQNRITLDFLFWLKNTNLSKPKHWSRDILWRHKTVFQVFTQLGISFFQIFLFPWTFNSKVVLCVT